MTTILITGGAGYIGSHNVKYLRAKGYDIVVLDDLNCGFADAVMDAPLVKSNIGDAVLLDQVFTAYRIDAVSILHPSSRLVNRCNNHQAIT